MYLIAGLGNPGKKYASTRHNVGFRAIGNLADEYGIKARSQKQRAITGTGEIAGEKVVLAQPLTYMNNSGRAINALLSAYSLEPSELIVIYDDLDLVTGDIRIKKGGGSGGHKGLDSIIKEIDTADFLRIRIGIDHPGAKGLVTDYVLGYFNQKEDELIEEAVTTTARAVKVIIESGYQQAMNKFN